jgi:hypothetical protein
LPLTIRNALTAGLLTPALLAAHGRGNSVLLAQEPLRVRPLVAVTETYDSNISSSSLQPLSDFVMRISPGVEAEYRSALTKLQGRYTLDLERFARESSLSDVGGRQLATVDLQYGRSRRLSLGLDAAFQKTNTPSDLGTVTGLILHRAAAERFQVRPSIERHLDPLTSGTIEYEFAADRLAGGSRMRLHRMAVGIDRDMSRRNLLALDYEVRQWAFRPGGNVGAGFSRPDHGPTSHVFRAGWSRPITRSIDVQVQAGPVVTDGVATPDFTSSLRYGTRPTELSIGYTRTQTTIVGLAGVADTQGITASGSLTPHQGLQLRVSPGVSRTRHQIGRTDAWRVAFDAERHVGSSVLLRLSYEVNVQRGRLITIGDPSVSRHIVQLSVLPVPRPVAD